MRRILVLPLLLALAGCATLPGARAPQPNHFFVFLRRPPDAPKVDDATAQKIQAAHMANMRVLYEEGHLVMAGPFLDDTTLRGVFVFRTADPAAAREWLASDPAVKANRLAGDIHPFHAPLSTFSKPAPDAKVFMDRYAMVILSGSGAVTKSMIDDVDRSGKLAMAAVFPDNDPIRAVFILAATPEEATALVPSGFHAEVHPWMSQRGVLPR